MSTQPNKLYRSNINFMPVTVNPPKDFNLSQDYVMDNKFNRINYNKNTLTSTNSAANLKSKQFNNSVEGSKQTIPFLHVKDIQNTSFMSIDDAYLNPKFLKKKDHQLNKILPNNITDLQYDTQSIGGRSVKTYQGQDEYYKYWKSKAHQYLQQNFRLRQQNKNLKQQMDSMRQNITKQLKRPKHTDQNNDIQQREDKSFSYLEGIFKKKLDELENELKEKTTKIISLQDKVLQMNRKILGQEERGELMERLGNQVETLTHENILLKKHVYQLENNHKSRQQIQIDGNQIGMRQRYRSKEIGLVGQRKYSVEKGSRR